jgi:transmembrane sensor
MNEKNPDALKNLGADASFAAQGESVRPCAPLFSTGDIPNMPSMDHAAVRQDQALDWLLQLQQRPNDAAVRAEFQRWHEADEANARAFRKAERVWQLTGQLQPATRAQWPDSAPQTAAPHPALLRVSPAVPVNARRPRRPIRWLSAALAACLVIAIAPQLSQRWQADYRTGPDETRDVTLTDGSVVQLDSDSAIAVDFDEHHRGVRLLSGQAFFKVTPDKSKPFQVRALTMQVTVTGTAFNVELASGHTSVAVEHGSVQVDDWKAGQTLAALLPGQRLDYRDSQVTQRAFDPTQAAVWRQGQLIANDMPIDEVLEQLRRYVPGVVVMNDASLGSQRITGVYDIRHPQAALRAMVKPYGGRVEGYSPWVLVVRGGAGS